MYVVHQEMHNSKHAESHTINIYMFRSLLRPSSGYKMNTFCPVGINELHMFHICTLQHIAIYIVHQQMHNRLTCEQMTTVGCRQCVPAPTNPTVQVNQQTETVFGQHIGYLHYQNVLCLPTEPMKGDKSQLWFRQALCQCLCCSSMCKHVKVHPVLITKRHTTHKYSPSLSISFGLCHSHNVDPFSMFSHTARNFDWSQCQCTIMPAVLPLLCSQCLPPLAPCTTWASDNYFQNTSGTQNLIYRILEL